MKFDHGKALTRAEALEALKARWEFEKRTEHVPVGEACGRVLAQDCHAAYDLPRHRVSSFDGIAVRAADFAQGVPDTGEWVRGMHFAQADTGDDFPDEFDTIIAAEDVGYDEAGRLMLDPALEVKAGNAIKRAGATMGKGELLYEAGTLLGPEALAILAAGGWAEAPVVARLKVAYLPTGTELVHVGTVPERGQNVQTNSLMLGAYFAQWGAEMVAYDIVADDRAALGIAIDRALAEADVVLVNGGSSRGPEDFNSELLQERASWFSHGVKAVPGRPIGLAVIEGKPAINVPGPMIAAYLAADWLVRGLVCHYYGQPVPQRVKVPAVLDAPLGARPGFEHLARLVARDVDGVLHAAPIPNSATLAENIRSANAFLAVPAGVRYEAGDKADIELLGTKAG